MKFTGIVKVSTVDYPKKIVSTLFTGGCNFKCEYCHNPEIVNPDKDLFVISEEGVFEFIEKRKSLIDGLCITGGEPSIWGNELIEFIKKIKTKFGDDFLVKVDTNGSNPKFIDEIKEIVDFIAMDLKALDYSSFSNVDIETIKKSIEKIKRAKDYEIRITMYPEYIKEEDFEKYAEILEGIKETAIQQYNPKKVLVDKNIRPYDEKTVDKFVEILTKKGIHCKRRVN